MKTEEALLGRSLRSEALSIHLSEAVFTKSTEFSYIIRFILHLHLILILVKMKRYVLFLSTDQLLPRVGGCCQSNFIRICAQYKCCEVMKRSE